MKELLTSLNNIQLFILFVMPGILSIQIYRLLMPAKELDWGNIAISGLFYSSVNYALCLPLLWLMMFQCTFSRHPFLYALVGIIVLLIAPIIWPVIFSKLIRSKKFNKNLQIPMPSAWDYYFDKRVPCFVLVHLKNGKLLGGYYGDDSYATSFPNEGEIYIETVYNVFKDGKFGTPVPDSKGTLIRKADYDYIELFSIPNQNGGGNDIVERETVLQVGN